MSQRRRWALWAAGLALAAGLGGWAWALLERTPPAAVLAAAPPAPALSPQGTAPPPAPVAARPPPAPLLAAAEAAPDAPPRSSVDLEVLRRQLPDNLYWSLGVATDDPAVLEARAAQARRWNAALGKVQAGEASDEELHAYFEHQRRLHQDYLDFSAQVLATSGDQLSERDRGLFELSAKMHHDRLAELPAQEAEAVARKQLQDQRRAAWEAAGRP
jgi:hypothetical protein